MPVIEKTLRQEMSKAVWEDQPYEASARNIESGIAARLVGQNRIDGLTTGVVTFSTEPVEGSDDMIAVTARALAYDGTAQDFIGAMLEGMRFAADPNTESVNDIGNRISKALLDTPLMKAMDGSPFQFIQGEAQYLFNIRGQLRGN